MSSESPVALLFSSDGFELSVQNAIAIPTSTRGLIAMGSDGTNSRYLSMDTSGRPIVVGPGTAGTPAGGVLSIQGVSGGQAIPVSGTLTTTISAVSNTGATPPATAIYIGGSVTTGSPSYTTGQMNALSLTLAGALRVDGSAVTQPVSGTVTANAGTGTFSVSGTVTSNQGTAAVTANAWPVKITDGTNVNVFENTTPTGTEYGLIVRNIPSGTQTISGTVTANAGTGNFTVVQSTAANLNASVVGTGVAGTPAGGVLTIQGSASGTPIPVTQTIVTAGTSTLTNVASSATNVTVLASNTNRRGATIYNDSSSLLYMKLGTTASATSFTIKLFPYSYWEVPFNYTGEIDGIWASATGAARVDELTA